MKEKTSLGKKEKKCFLDWLLNLQDERNLSFEDVCEEIATTFFAGILVCYQNSARSFQNYVL